jgi:hypothetical protein
LFFSGLAFSGQLREESNVAAALSSNLLGAMLGGFCEYNSMYFGFRSLYVIALAVYALALVATVLSRKRALALVKTPRVKLVSPLRAVSKTLPTA